MKFKYLLIFIILALSVSAIEQSLGTYKVNECINLVQVCGTCSSINITGVLFPNSTTSVSNQEMSKDGALFNLTYCQTPVVGKYIVTGVGDLDAVNTAFAYTFDISSSGRSQDTSSGITSLVFIVGVIGTIIILLYIAYQLDSSHFILKLILLLSGITLMLLIPISTMFNLSPDTTFYKVFLWIYALIWIYIIVYFVYYILKKMGIIVTGGEDNQQ